MNESLYHAFFQQEEHHWWFAARSEIVQAVLRTHGNVRPGETILDIGCGTGAVLKTLAETYDAIGIDTSDLAIQYSRRRGLRKVFRMPIAEFPYEQHDVRAALLLDVIEHIEDDVDMLRSAREIVGPTGRVIVTVPAHMWLWSAHDEVNQHQRRYSKATLTAALRRAGLEPVKMTFFNTLLFPAVAATKIVSRLRGATTAHVSPDHELPAANEIFKAIFAAEKHLVPHVTFPTGVSLLAVAQPRTM